MRRGCCERPEEGWPRWTRGAERGQVSGEATWRLRPARCISPGEEGGEGRRRRVEKARLLRNGRSRLWPRGGGEKQLSNSGSFFPVPSPCPEWGPWHSGGGQGLRFSLAA